MWLCFNSNGALVEPALQHGPAPRAGTTNFQIFAYFEGIDLSVNNFATIKLIKPDLNESSYPLLAMKRVVMKYEAKPGEHSDYFKANGGPNNDGYYPGFLFDFSNFTGDQNVAILLDAPGLWKASITLYSVGHLINVQGTSTFNVQSGTVNDTGTEITIDELMAAFSAAIAGKINVDDGIFVIRSLDTSVTDALNVGQWVLYTGNDNLQLMQKVAYVENGVDKTRMDLKFNFVLTSAQWDAINSGITSGKVENYDSHLLNKNNPHDVTKSQVGLENVVNTGDSATPVSGGTTKFTTGGAFTELNKKVDKTITVNGHPLNNNVTVTKSDVGLGNVDNTSDANKPISTATQNALNLKADKSQIIALEANPNIPSGTTPISLTALKIGTVYYAVSAGESGTVYNAGEGISISNGVISVSYTVENAASGGTTKSLVTTGEKYTWNHKQDALVSGTNIKTINGNSLLGSGDLVITGDTINPMTAVGDLIVGGTVTGGKATPTRLGKGNNGELLRVNGSGNVSYGKNLPFIDCTGSNPVYPSQANTDGLITVLCASEPPAKYDGYIYIVKSNVSEQMQALIDKINALPTHLYRHSFRVVAAISVSNSAAIYVNIYTTSSTAFTLQTLRTYLENNDELIAGSGYVMDGNGITAILSHISLSSSLVTINGYNLTGDTAYSQAATGITDYTPVQVY